MPKKNLRRIPSTILHKIDKFKESHYIVGCSSFYTKDEIAMGILNHLNVKLLDGKIEFPEEQIPKASQGTYSNRNINGQIIKRKDLPMEQYSITVEAPNWGDDYYGTHDVTWTKERYVKEFIPPHHSTLKIECLEPKSETDNYIIKFEINEIIDRNSIFFYDRVLFCLNLLQENVYKSDIFIAGTSFSEYLSTIQLSWDILPPGTKDEALERIFRGSKPTSQQLDTASDRYSFFDSLNPENLIYGTSGLVRYFGAQLNENLVVFENVRYGNAIYIMYEEWRELSTKSRIDLLSGKFGMNFDRVVHTNGWKNRVKKIIKSKRQTLR